MLDVLHLVASNLLQAGTVSPLLFLNKGPAAHSATKQWWKEAEIWTQVRLAPLLQTQEMESQWEGRLFQTALPGADQCSLAAPRLWH